MREDTGKHTESYYAATARGARERPALAGDVRDDVCVIGGGFTGLSAALHLAEKGYNVCLLEAAKIGWGASGRNGGQVSGGQRQDQVELENWLGRDSARDLWDIADSSVKTVKALVSQHRIDCDLKPGVMAACLRKSDVGWYHAYGEKLARDYEARDMIPLSKADVAAMLGSDRYQGGLLDRSACHLHPLNYALGLATAAEVAGATLYEASRVTRIREGKKVCVHTNGGSVSADHLVLACNGYLGTLDPGVAGHIMPINNFILATEPLDDATARRINRDDVAVYDTKFVLDYFRLSADRRLLWGGGETYSHRFPADIAAFVRKYMLKTYPDLAGTRIDYAWGGTLAITRNRMPHFGRRGGNIYFAQGYSGHGVAMATEAGKMIAEALSSTAERFDIMAGLEIPRLPGGTLLRRPGMLLAMLFYALRDRL